MANSDKNIRITTSKNKTTFPNIVFTGSAAGNSVITVNILDDNTMSFESNEGQVFSLDSNLTVGTIWGVSDVSGIPLLRASAGATIGIAEFSGSTVGIGTANPGPYKLNVRGMAAFASTADGHLSFIFDSSQTANNAFLGARRASAIRFYNTTDTTYGAIKASTITTNYTLTLPSATPTAGSASSFLTIDSSGAMSFRPAVTRLPMTLRMASALLPTVGADNNEFILPFAGDGVSSVTYRMRRVDLRSSVYSTGGVGTTIRIEKYAFQGGGVGVTLFQTNPSISAGSTTNIMSIPLCLIGAAIAETTWTTFAGTHVTAVSGDKLRLFYQNVGTGHRINVQLIMDTEV